jgi:hypothetical protein
MRGVSMGKKMAKEPSMSSMQVSEVFNENCFVAL